MNNFDLDQMNQKEYQTVILAALLHDIGKLLCRGDDKYKGSHQEASSKFITDFKEKLKNDEFYDIDLIKLIAQYHHSTKQDTLKDPYFINKSRNERNRIWKLISIIKRADSYSCAERNLEQQKRRDISLKRAPLDSIFANINLDIESHEETYNCRYHLEAFDPLTSFPAPIKALNEREIKELIEGFEEDIPNFCDFKRIEHIINGWLNLLERYNWSVPSDTRYETSDVSLYDHLRSSAAIAACIYKRHIIAIEMGKRLDRRNEFILIGGDFSGIQNYIFDITNKGSGGASKRLRARSFFIFLFTEATIHKILHALDLPLFCNLFSAGGKFLILAPNLENINIALQKVKSEIEYEIHRTFFNQFSFLMYWMEIRGYREQFKIHNFFETADSMFHQLETEKLNKSRDILLVKDTGLWNVNAFKATELYAQYKETGDCSICGKGPGNCEDKDFETKESVPSCSICLRDKYKIGERLPKANFIAFGKGKLEGKKEGEEIVIFAHTNNTNAMDTEKYYVKLLKNNKNHEDKGEYYLIYDIRNNREEPEINDHNHLIRKFIANHVPLNANEKVLSFEEISKFSRWQKDGKNYGSDLLGILKADMDNLGLIFSKGFEHPKKVENSKEKLEIRDIKTVSRFLTMSRMIEAFFSGWIKGIMGKKDKQDIIKELIDIEGITNKERFNSYLQGNQIDFKNIYTVYSGGDDLVLVGPWETMVIFSIFLNIKFRKFTCNNKFIRLSAGLSFVKPRYPVASAIRQADELLNQSKEKGKKRLSLFGTTIEWDRLPELINFFLFLNEKLNDESSEINMAFLYRLLEYHRMALRYFDENDITGLKYLSALSYDIGRNIVERDKERNIKKGHEEHEVLQALLNKKPDKNSLIYNLKISLFWTLYRNRKYGKDQDINNLRLS